MASEGVGLNGNEGSGNYKANLAFALPLLDTIKLVLHCISTLYSEKENTRVLLESSSITGSAFAATKNLKLCLPLIV